MTLLLTLLLTCLPIVTLCYIAWCAANPWGTCLRCAPGGHNRTCRACNGTGMRPRIGWQLWTYLSRSHRDGTR
ncbi:hypothetical protein [Microbispora sp. H10949]|uniref:hypothetical protein n=1 Tax=Microbispora sp. H10949 TaxID=2729111 RepID=UPI0016047FB6|nr:hypothetical protein [Microbispora sp. H10949]